MRVLGLTTLSALLVVSACSRGRALPGGDSGIDSIVDVSPGEPRADGNGGDGDSDSDGSGETGPAPDAISCGGGATFRMDAVDPSAWFAYDSFQDCGGTWLTIYDAVGTEVQIGHPDLHCCLLTDCGACQPVTVCGAAFSNYPVPTTRAWDGTMFPMGQCGASAKACVMKGTCAPAGHYTARMCGHRTPNDTPTCVDVPFDLPTADAVVGTLPQ